MRVFLAIVFGTFAVGSIPAHAAIDTARGDAAAYHRIVAAEHDAILELLQQTSARLRASGSVDRAALRRDLIELQRRLGRVSDFFGTRPTSSSERADAYHDSMNEAADAAAANVVALQSEVAAPRITPTEVLDRLTTIYREVELARRNHFAEVRTEARGRG